jgi:hypothetical protein
MADRSTPRLLGLSLGAVLAETDAEPGTALGASAPHAARASARMATPVFEAVVRCSGITACALLLGCVQGAGSRRTVGSGGSIPLPAQPVAGAIERTGGSGRSLE